MTTYSISSSSSSPAWSSTLPEDFFERTCPLTNTTFKTLLDTRTSKSPLVIARVYDSIVPQKFSKGTSGNHEHPHTMLYMEAKSLWKSFASIKKLKNPVTKRFCKKIELVWLAKNLQDFGTCDVSLTITKENYTHFFSRPESTAYSNFEYLSSVVLSCQEEDQILRTQSQLDVLLNNTYQLDDNLGKLLSQDISQFFYEALENPNIMSSEEVEKWEERLYEACKKYDQHPLCTTVIRKIEKNLKKSYFIAALPKQKLADFSILSCTPKSQMFFSVFVPLIEACGTYPQKFSENVKIELLHEVSSQSFGVPSETLSIALDVLKSTPDNRTALFVLGRIYKNGLVNVTKDFQRASAFFFKIIEKTESDAEVFCSLADMYFLGSHNFPKNWKEAVFYYSKALPYMRKGEYPRERLVNALISLGNAYYFGGSQVPKDLMRAFEYYEEAYKISSSDGFLSTQIANIFAEGNMKCKPDMSLAATLYVRAIGSYMNDEDDGTKYNIVCFARRYTFTKYSFSWQTDKNTSFLVGCLQAYLTNIRRCYFNPTKQAHFANKILEIDPSNVEALVILADAYTVGDEKLEKNINRAIEFLKQAIVYDKNFPIPYVLLANIYLKDGPIKNTKLMESYCNMAIQCNPAIMSIFDPKLKEAYIKAQEEAKNTTESIQK